MRTARLLTVCRRWGLPAWGGWRVDLPGGGDVPAQGVYLPRGVYLPGGVPAKGCTCPGGVPAQGVGCPPIWTDRHL